jgi:hypothetical protein
LIRQVHKLDFKKDFDLGFITIGVKIEATVGAGSGDSVMTVTLGGELSGDADIELPNGREVSIPVNLLPEEEEAGKQSDDDTDAPSYTGESKDVTVDGVPYTVAEKFTPNSIEFDVDTSGPIKIGSTEVGDTDVDATLTITRNPHPTDPLPLGGHR